MKQNLVALLALLIVTVATQCTQTPANKPEKADAQAAKPDSASMISRGEYLVTIGGCNDCHSPKVMTPTGPAPDPKRLLSGHPADEPLPAMPDRKVTAPGSWVLFSAGLTAAVGPWGTSYAANLTPDDTGIGAWSFGQFQKAIREGKSKGMDGTRMLLPPMPLANFAKMSDEDLRAMFAYLKSLPPVKNVVPNPVPPVM